MSQLAQGKRINLGTSARLNALVNMYYDILSVQLNECLVAAYVSFGIHNLILYYTKLLEKNMKMSITRTHMLQQYDENISDIIIILIYLLYAKYQPTLMGLARSFQRDTEKGIKVLLYYYHVRVCPIIVSYYYYHVRVYLLTLT